MPKSSLEADIRARIQSVASELSGLIRQAALESVQMALGGGTTTSSRKPRGRRRGKRRGRASTAAKNGEIAQRVLANVRAHPGQGVSEIGAALKVSSENLRPAMLKLLAEKSVRTTGQRRGTKYHPGGARAAATPAGKKARRKVRRPTGKMRARRRGARKAASKKTASKRGASKKAASKKRASKKAVSKKAA